MVQPRNTHNGWSYIYRFLDGQFLQTLSILLMQKKRKKNQWEGENCIQPFISLLWAFDYWRNIWWAEWNYICNIKGMSMKQHTL